MKTIVIINQPLNNRGDEAAHRSLVRSLNKELVDAKIITLDIGSNSNSIRQISVESPLNSYINIPVRLKGASRFLPEFFAKYGLYRLANVFPFYRKYSRIIKKADLVINAPGGICMGAFQNWKHIFYLLIALRNNKNVFYFGRSIGPFPVKTFSNRIFKKRSIEILGKLKFISLRDKKSMQIADEMGVKYSITVDTAFLDIPTDKDIPIEIKGKLSKDYIVFVPNSLTWHPDFEKIEQFKIDKLYLAIFDYLLNKFPNYKIVLLPQLFNAPFHPDYEYFLNITKSYSKNQSIIVLPDSISSDIQQKIIKQSKLVIGTRYHSIIFAINNQVPVISLSYEHKMSGLLDILDLSGCNIDFRSMLLSAIYSEDFLISKIDEALNYCYNLEQKALEARSIAQKSFMEMISKI